jgi:hypothetical protein
MLNSIEALHGVIRDTKALRRYASHPDKARKHRYERRKVRGFIRLGDWHEDESA